MEQIEEETSFMHQKLENLRRKLLGYIGGKLNAARYALAHFIIENSQRMDKVSADVTAIGSK